MVIEGQIMKKDIIGAAQLHNIIQIRVPLLSDTFFNKIIFGIAVYILNSCLSAFSS